MIIRTDLHAASSAPSQRAAATERVTSDRAQPSLKLGRIGRDNGRLVLQLERHLALSSAQAREALTATGRELTDRSTGALRVGEVYERWDVNDEGAGTRVAFTVWIDAEDVATASRTGADCHTGFDRFVEGLEAHDTSRPPVEHISTDVLTEAYLSAFAAALADTD